MRVPDTERAWAAGFFDGEGTAGCFSRGSGRGLRLVTSITQKDRRALVRFKQAVNCGNIYEVRTRGHFQWQGTSTRTFHQVMDVLWKYLGPVKQTQFARAVRKYAARKSRRR